MGKIKNVIWTILFLFGSFYSQGQIVISEIMYNPPEAGMDSLEFIELYNTTSTPIELNNYRFTSGIIHNFTYGTIPPNGYYLIALDSAAFQSVFNLDVAQWNLDGLRNSGEEIIITDRQGREIDRVSYSDSNGWPVEADGNGASIELCDVNADNNDPSNWKASTIATGRIVNGLEVLATPTTRNSVTCDGPLLLITEIMYTDPNGDTSKQFVELYNAGTESIDLDNYAITGNVEGTIENILLAPGEFAIGSTTPDIYSMQGLLAFEVNTNFSNDNSITISDIDGGVVTEVTFSKNAPWPVINNTEYTSIHVCDLSLIDSDPANWRESRTNGATKINPGEIADCLFSIPDIIVQDENGESVEQGRNVSAIGTVHGINYNGNGGLHFTIIDENKIGIAVIHPSNSLGYVPREGDVVSVQGTVIQIEGYTSLFPTRVLIESSGADLVTPILISGPLSETNESQLVTIQNVSIKDIYDWRIQAEGFEVVFTDGTHDYPVWIDDQTDLYAFRDYPTGTVSITGIVDQVDSTEPFNDGYRILPRYLADIDPFIPFVTEYPLYDISEFASLDDEGVVALNDTQCSIAGVVYGVNLRPSGLQFTVIDENHNGIGVFNVSENHGYTVREGDEIIVSGVVTHLNGLTQIVSDNILIVSIGKSLLSPIATSFLGEATESKLVTIENLSFVNPNDWRGNGSSFTFEAQDEEGNIFEVRIDGDVDLSEQNRPSEPFNVTGIGSQFDPSAPYTEMYQIVPRYIADIDGVNRSENVLSHEVSIYPNPTLDAIHIRSEVILDRYTMYSIAGAKVDGGNYHNLIDISQLEEGSYILHLEGEGKTYTQFVIKE